MTFNIDYNRGVLKWTHPTGVEVYMYLDSPGEYISSHGTPVAKELAAGAGAPVEAFEKKRLLKSRMAMAMETISAELEMGEQKALVVAEKGGFKIVDIGLGRHQVQDPDGENLTATPLPLPQAQLLLEQLVPDPKPEPKAAEKPAEK